MPSSAPVPIGQRYFLSQFLMIVAMVALLGWAPCISSSPTSSRPVNHPNKIDYRADALLADPNDDQATFADESSLLPPAVHQTLSGSSPFWYVQPRAHANQFLVSNGNQNEIMVPKWFTRLNGYGQAADRFSKDGGDANDDDDDDDDVPSGMDFHRRSSSGQNGAYVDLKKRKQMSKPPMEVMNEIVNSIYL